MELFLYEYRRVLITLLIVIYLLGAFFTYGYTKVRLGYGPEGVLCSTAGWPIYWGCRGVGYVADLSEQVFTPSPPPKPEKG